MKTPSAPPRISIASMLLVLAAMSSSAIAAPPLPHGGARSGAFLHDFAVPVPPAHGDSPDVRLRVDHRAARGPVGDGIRLVVGSTVTRRGPGGRVPTADDTVASEFAVDGARLVGSVVMEPEVADGSRYVYDASLNVWTRTLDGAVFTYGERDAKRYLVGPGLGQPGPTCAAVDSLCNTAAWELTSAVDSSGNRISYFYEGGAAAAPGKAQAQALRPARIEWLGGLAVLTFSWEDRPDSRLDLSTGAAEVHTVRLAGIDVSTRGLDWASFDLEYTDEPGASCDGSQVDEPVPATRSSRLRRILRSRTDGDDVTTRVERCFERAADNTVAWTAQSEAPLATPQAPGLSSTVSWGDTGTHITHRATTLPAHLDGDAMADLLVIAFQCDLSGCVSMHEAYIADPGASDGFDRAPQFPHSLHFESRRRRISRAWRSALNAHLDGAWAHHGRGFAVVDLDRDGAPELLVEQAAPGAGPDDVGDVMLYTFDAEELEFDAGALVPIDALDLRFGSFSDIDGDGYVDLVLRAHQAHCIESAFDNRGMTSWISNAAAAPFFDSADELSLDNPLERTPSQRPADYQALRDECDPGPDEMRGPPLHPPVRGSGESVPADHTRYLDVNFDGLADAVIAFYTCWEWEERNEPASRGWLPEPGSLYSRVFYGDGRGGFVDSGLDAGGAFLFTSKAALHSGGEFTLEMHTSTVGALDLDRDGHPELARDGFGRDWQGLDAGFDTFGSPAWMAPDLERTPVAADFDGDGFADLLELDASDGSWEPTLHHSTAEVVGGRVLTIHTREEGPLTLGYGFSAQAPHANPDLRRNLEVVEDVVGRDGVVRFAYGEGATDAEGSLGFGVVERREMSGATTRWGFAQQRGHLVGPLQVAARWRADGTLHDAIVQLHGYPSALAGPRVVTAREATGRGAFNPPFRTCAFEAGTDAGADLATWLDDCVGFESSLAPPASWTLPPTSAALGLPAMDAALLEDDWDAVALAAEAAEPVLPDLPDGVALPTGTTDVSDLRDAEAELTTVMAVTETSWHHGKRKPLTIYALGDVDTSDDDRITHHIWQMNTPAGAPGPSYRLWQRSVTDASGDRLQVVRRRWFAVHGFDLPTRIETCGRTDAPEACAVEMLRYTNKGQSWRHIAADGGVTRRWFNWCGRIFQEKDPVGRVTWQSWSHRCLPYLRTSQGGSVLTEHGPFNELTREVVSTGANAPAQTLEIHHGAGVAGFGTDGDAGANPVVAEARRDALGTVELDYVDGYGRPFFSTTCVSATPGDPADMTCVSGSERVDELTVYRVDGRVAGRTEAYWPGVDVAPTTAFEYDDLGRVTARHEPGHILLGEMPPDVPWLEGEQLDALSWSTTRQVSGPRYAARQTPDGVTTHMAADGVGRTRSINGEWAETVTLDAFGRAVRVERADRPTEVTTYGDDQRRAALALDETTPCVPGADESVDAACTWTQTFGYDAAGRETERVDPDGRGMRFVFDAVGRPVELWERPLGEAEELTETWTWVAAAGGGLPRVVHTDVRTGAETVTTRDSAGRPHHRTIAELEESWSWDARGALDSYVDVDGIQTVHGYDGLGELTSVDSDAHGLLTWQRDARGAVVSETDADAVSTSIRRTWSGLPAIIRDGVGHVLSWRRYDAAGRVTDSFEGGVHRAAAYDARGRLLREDVGVDPLLPDEPGLSWRELTYDSADRPQTQTVWPVEGLTATTTTTYDAWGRVESATDAESATTSHGYDVMGRLRYQIDGAGHEATWRYDAHGRLAEAQQPRIGSVTYGYTEGVTYDHSISGSLTQLRKLTTTDGEGHVSEVYLDAAGRRVAQSQPDGGRTELSYVGLRADTQLWLGPDPDADPGSTALIPLREKRSTYESGTGRLDSVRGPALPGFSDADPSVFTVSFGWTSAGRPEHLDAPSGTTSFTYEAGLVATETALGLTRTVLRDGLSPRATGELLLGVDGAVRTIDHSFDAAGRVTAVVTTAMAADLVTLAETTEQHFFGHNAYDQPEAEWRVVGGLEHVRHDWMYDATGRPTERATSIDGSAAAHGTTAWDWYGNGLLKSVTTPTGLGIQYDYEASFPHRLHRVRQVDGAVFASFQTWDERGLPTRWVGIGRAVETTWDAMGRMATTTTLRQGSEVDLVSQDFDALGFLRSETLRTSQGSELHKAYGHDPAGRLSWEQWTGDEILAWDYVLDAAGNRERTDMSVGGLAPTPTMTATYDSGRPTHVDGSSLEYDAWRGVSVDQRGNGYVRDATGHVSAVVTAAQTLELGRDAAGLPVTASTGNGPARVTTWGLDAESHPLQVETGDGRHMTYVTAGDLLLARVTEAHATWRAPLVLDGRGSLMRIMNWQTPSANAFGEGAMINNPAERLSFHRMEAHPGLTGVHFARHRAYDSRTGRFLSPDPTGLGGGLHREAYGAANPTRFSDAMGLSCTTFGSGLDIDLPDDLGSPVGSVGGANDVDVVVDGQLTSMSSGMLDFYTSSGFATPLEQRVAELLQQPSLSDLTGNPWGGSAGCPPGALCDPMSSSGGALSALASDQDAGWEPTEDGKREIRIDIGGEGEPVVFSNRDRRKRSKRAKGKKKKKGRRGGKGSGGGAGSLGVPHPAPAWTRGGSLPGGPMSSGRAPGAGARNWASSVRRWAGGVDWRSAGWTALEIGVGFTPLGVGYDLYNIAKSARDVYDGKEGAAANLFFDSVGLLPGGDLLKAGRKIKSAADLAGVGSKAADVVRRLPDNKFGTPGTFMVLRHSDKTNPAELRKKAGWLDDSARAGDAWLRRNTKGVRTGRPQRQAKRQGMIKTGHQADHKQDLCLGGTDCLANIGSLHAGTNMSVGPQLRGQFGVLPSRTPVSRVYLQEPNAPPVVKALGTLGAGKALK